MRKTVVIALVLGLLAGFQAFPATAAKKKAKPVATTLYFHGAYPMGEVDGVEWVANSTPPTTTLTPDEPTDPFPKSMNFFSPALNDQCSGLPLAFPTFVGDLAGTIKGDAKITAHFASAPGTIKARLWTDTPVFSCNDAFVEPAAEVDVELPSGQGEVEIVFPGLNLKAEMNVMVEILAYSGTDYKGQVGRLLYDSPSALTRIEFKCIPASGKTC